jgi:hypothetical protein
MKVETLETVETVRRRRRWMTRRMKIKMTKSMSKQLSGNIFLALIDVSTVCVMYLVI